MPRERSPNRDKAFEVWRDSNGEISNREIAIQLGISEKTVGGWKAKDRWIEKLNGVLQTNERSTPKRAGAPKHNQNAVGNRGGAPLQNDNAVTHGFFRKYFPEAVHELLADVAAMSELDKLWMSIQTQFTAIIHAQKVMFVSDSEDHSDFQTKKISGESMDVEEYERQWSFQKQANFLSAQARAMSELRSSIKTFLELADESDLRRLRLQQMQKDIELKNIEIERVKNPGGEEQEDDGFMDALHAEASEVWNDGDSDGAEES